MARLRFVFVALIIALSIVGCDKSSTGPGGGGVTITVSAGTHPTYSWTGGNAYTLSVVRVSSPGNVVWGLVSPGRNGIVSPIAHGTGAVMDLTNPLNMITESATTEKAALTAGVAYRVTISMIGATDAPYKDFTP